MCAEPPFSHTYGAKMSGPSNAQPTGKPAFHRTQRLIDPRWQMGAACAASLLLLGTGALYLFGSKLLASAAVANKVGANSLPAVVLVADVLFFLGVVAVVHTVVVRMTHSVVGPALVVERGLRSMREGRYDSRFSLRDGDYLLPVAEAGQNLNDHLSKQIEDLFWGLEEIRDAVGENAEVIAAITRIEASFRIEEREGAENGEPRAPLAANATESSAEQAVGSEERSAA